ncbi:cupin domain-containing protein [Nocardia sp. NPDC049707]|uniref:cupin domain-containing protein n=1 Tax=Nocardia sp. NPDC049707 TaxID=3154735 RepID=UPI003446069A
MTGPQLTAGTATDAVAAPLDRSPLPEDQVISGPEPTVGNLSLGALAGVSVGIWEIGPSVTRDVEADEMFVVLTGSATVSFEDGTPDLTLRPGTVARLASGQRTRWAVTETLRKIYVLAPAAKEDTA